MSAVLDSLTSRHFVTRFIDPDIIRWPYPYTYVRNVFPEEYYRQILDNLPPDDAYPDRQFENRAMTRQTELPQLGEFWMDLSIWMMKPDVMRRLLDIFPVPQGKIQVDLRLVKDSMGYAIKPHTDIKAKLISFLFYLPENDHHPDCGTRVYVPKQEGFKSDGTRRYPFEDFTDVYAAPYMPNSCFAFPRSDISFHGLPATDFGPRNVLLLNIYK